MLLFVLYLGAFFAYIDSSLPHRYGNPIIVLGGVVLIVICSLGLAVRARDFQAPSFRLAISFAGATLLVAALFAVGPALDESSAWLFDLASLLREAIFGYWATILVLVGLMAYSGLHRPCREHLSSVVTLPVMIWGIESTCNHELRYRGLDFSPTSFLQILWHGALVATGVAMGLLLTLLAWYRWYGRSEMPVSRLVIVVIVVSTVAVDWLLSLFFASMAIVSSID